MQTSNQPARRPPVGRIEVGNNPGDRLAGLSGVFINYIGDYCFVTFACSLSVVWSWIEIRVGDLLLLCRRDHAFALRSKCDMCMYSYRTTTTAMGEYRGSTGH